MNDLSLFAQYVKQKEEDYYKGAYKKDSKYTILNEMISERHKVFDVYFCLCEVFASWFPKFPTEFDFNIAPILKGLIVYAKHEIQDRHFISRIQSKIVEIIDFYSAFYDIRSLMYDFSLTEYTIVH